MNAASRSTAVRRSRAVLRSLQKHESRNVLHVEPDFSWPIVWDRARGCKVWDADGKAYLDLTAAFGVAAAGHANPRVVAAGQRQLARLPHAMGDVHPHPLKADLARTLAEVTFGRWSGEPAKVIFSNSGFEAVEAALKTAKLATGKAGVIAFEGAYHGLGYGALNATHRAHFRGLFRDQLREFGTFLPYPSEPGKLAALELRLVRAIREGRSGAILVEPVQGRGGIKIPPADFLTMLRRLCDKHGLLLILDEIFTGFGRTGRWFACEHSHTVPDVICLGKALAGGFPISAVVGRASLMDRAWPPSSGEAIHTSTFLGNPVGCAMALAQIEELRRLKLPSRADRLGRWLLAGLAALPVPGQHTVEIRGLGLMAGLEYRDRNGVSDGKFVFDLAKRLLARGCIFLPEGGEGNVLSLTPPLTIASSELQRALAALRAELEAST